MRVFNLPDLGEGLAEAKIREWYVKAGDSVHVDQPLLAVETAKAMVEIPSPNQGKIANLHAKTGVMVQTGAPLISFHLDEVVEHNQATVVGQLSHSETILENEPDIKPKTAMSTYSKRVQATPKVRQLAQSLKIDLSQVTPSSPHQHITLEDVRAHAKQNHPPLKATANRDIWLRSIPHTSEDLHGARRTMAHVMQSANQQVVLTSLFDDADITALNTPLDGKPRFRGLTLKLIRAMQDACQEMPALNAHFDAENLQRHLFKQINLGIAIDSPQGLFVPVIQNVGSYSDQVLCTKLAQLKSLAENAAFPANLLKHATITLSNIGTIAGRYATPIVVPPTVAIVAVGKVRDKLQWDSITQKCCCHFKLPLSLSFDHRAVTGSEAAYFLKAMITSLAALGDT